MITYNPGKWSVAFAFSLYGSVFPKALAWACPCALAAVALHIVIHSQDGIMDAVYAGDNAAQVLGGFSFILGFLVVFRSQQAYARWWEGGTLLQQLRGEWFNSYSCLIAFCNHDPDKVAEVSDLQHQFVRLYSLLFSCALHQVSTQSDAKFELITLDGFEKARLDFLWETPDRCEVVLQWIQRLIVESNQKELLKIAPPILSRVFNELGNGIVNLNNARKITEFPIPFPLAQTITIMLLFHAVVTPVVCAAAVNTSYWAGLISFAVTFSYWTINYIAVEIEMPFGEDTNDLPLQALQAEMNGSLCTLIDTRAQQVPRFQFEPKFHDKLKVDEVDFDDVTDGSQLFASRPSVAPRPSQKEAPDKCESPRNSPRGRNRKPPAHRDAARPEAMSDGATAPDGLQILAFQASSYQPAKVHGTGDAAGPPLRGARGDERHAVALEIGLSPALPPRGSKSDEGHAEPVAIDQTPAMPPCGDRGNDGHAESMAINTPPAISPRGGSSDEGHAESMVINLSSAVNSAPPVITHGGDPHRPGCERVLHCLDADPKGSCSGGGESSRAGTTTASSGAAHPGSAMLASATPTM